MPYKSYKPVSKEEMDKDEIEEQGLITQQHPVPREEMHRHRYDGHHSVCQTLREIYRLTDNEEIKLKCRLAMAMTKSMHEKLKRYKNGQS